MEIIVKQLKKEDKSGKVYYSCLWLGLVCIILFILQSSLSSFTNSFILNENSFSQPWRFVSSLFLHADAGHLLYNLFALLLFGIILENIIGTKRFLTAFFVSGIVANLIGINFYNSSLGASGAIFGVIGCLTILRPKMMVFAFGLPLPLFLASIVWVGIDVVRTFMPTNIGTIAHISGIFIGLVYGFYLRRNFTEERRYGERINISDEEIEEWENKYMGRERW